MCVLVTGSSGFIGQHLVVAFVQLGYQVIGLDIQVPLNALAGLIFEQCDILDARRLIQVFDRHRPELVVHLAARTDLDETRNIAAYAANSTGVHNVTDAVRATAGVKRCIYTSSQLVCRTGYVPRNESDYCPNTLYGESKVLTEKTVRQADGGGVEWCLVRPTTVWGPGMNRHYQRFFAMIRRGRYFHVGRRPLYKSYGYVGNVVHQYVELLLAPVDAVRGRTFYVADYQPLALREWVNAFQRELQAPPVPTVPETAARGLALAGDLMNALGWRSFPFNSFRLKNILTEYQFDLAATAAVCGPLPFNLADGVRETSRWVRTLAA